jgi:cytochrome P450
MPSTELLVTAGRSPNPTIQSSAVKGNIFLFMFAGHEANANTMTFLVHLLAMHPSLQRSFQSDIDAIPTPFSYPSSYNTAMSSLPGAVINEALRLYTVIPFILKSTWSTPQPITFGKETHNIPPDTLILMHTNATHRNPKYWPEPEKEKLGTGGMPYPVASFNPYHWIGNKDESNEDGWRRFLTPKPGTYFPFSEGLRGCLGKKFALVELCAVVCQLFSEYSVELAVDGVNDCESATEMSKEERIERWNRAHQKAEYEMSAGVEFNMSLRMTGEVPVRFVRRGMEIFGDVNESE